MADGSSFDPSKPLLFVAMPFGEKTEPGGEKRVDFDDLYQRCIQPAADGCDVEVIRADEETLGGFIHRPMYERLLLAEIVLADLTFANANVFYELGVRHAARPRSTILTYADLGAALPFDVAPVRAIPYSIDEHGLCSSPDTLIEALSDRIGEAMAGDSVDSPLFQLLDDYPGIDLAHDATEAFKERARLVSELTVRAYEAARPGSKRENALAALADVEADLLALPGVEEQVLVTLLLAYRDVEAWDEMVRLVSKMPQALTESLTVREQLALALNRRSMPGDRRLAIEILEAAIETYGRSAESFGILGRCFKDRWQEKASSGDAGADDALAQAIDAYGKGFEADPRDFYPGINLLTLLSCRGREDDVERVGKLIPVLEFALGRRGGLHCNDYWALAAILQLAGIGCDREIAARALSAMRDTEPWAWMWATSAADLRLLAESAKDRAWVEPLVEEMLESARG